MNPAFNPQPTFPFCPEQLDIFCFMTRHGFCGVVFEEVQGFLADTDDETLAQFGSRVYVKQSDVHYPTVESVPELVARYADMKKRREAARILSAPSTSATWKQKA